jgi:hypothetical protein
MPLAIIWCRAPGESIFDLGGIQFGYDYLIDRSTYNLMYVPNFIQSAKLYNLIEAMIFRLE